MTGRHVRTLVDGIRESGEHEVVWDGTEASGRTVSAGIYFARLEAPEGRAVRKIVRLRR